MSATDGPPRLSFDEVKDASRSHARAIAEDLFADGYAASNGRYWLARNPARDDASAGSFWIYLTGPKAGGWCDAAAGTKGDVFQLVQLARGGTSVEAKNWLAWRIGIGPAVSAAERQQRAADSDQRKRQAEAEAADRLEKDRRTAHAIWLHGTPLAAKDGAPNPDAALAFAYFEKRGIDLMRLPRLPGGTRLLRNQRHVETNKVFDALGTCVVGANGRFMALHRVFITAGADKIDEWLTIKGKSKRAPVRKTWPDYLGGFMPLWDGGTNMSAAKAASVGLLTPTIAGEGIEDGYANAIAKPDHRAIGTVSLGNLANLPFLASFDPLIVFKDNDWGKPQAQAQLMRGCDALAAKGYALRVASSFIGKDSNDLLKGE